jgi:hypothetical protein
MVAYTCQDGSEVCGKRLLFAPATEYVCRSYMVWPSNKRGKRRAAPIADKNNNAGIERRQPRKPWPDVCVAQSAREVDQLASSTISPPGKHIQGKRKLRLPPVTLYFSPKLSTHLEPIEAEKSKHIRTQPSKTPPPCPTNPPTTTTHGPIPPATTSALPKASNPTTPNPPPTTPSTNNQTPQTPGN